MCAILSRASLPQSTLDQALLHACGDGRADAVRLLLRHGARPQACLGRALVRAAAGHHAGVVQALLEAAPAGQLRPWVSAAVREAEGQPGEACELVCGLLSQYAA